MHQPGEQASERSLSLSCWTVNHSSQHRQQLLLPALASASLAGISDCESWCGQHTHSHTQHSTALSAPSTGCRFPPSQPDSPRRSQPGRKAVHIPLRQRPINIKSTLPSRVADTTLRRCQRERVRTHLAAHTFICPARQSRTGHDKQQSPLLDSSNIPRLQHLIAIRRSLN